ncbi:Serine/threonine-protein kinase AfsK [Phycisphaerae bacterium RAS1]|nr:Serine/threonine-protein kinase AfsK [Phycisphaerae bacterium RAS1]
MRLVKFGLPRRELRRSVCALYLLTTSASVAAAGDWFCWRGPWQDGAAREPAPVQSWSAAGENVVWKSPVGGRTTPIVNGDAIFLITPVGQGPTLGERVICLDRGTGATRWEQRFAVYHTDIVENRVGWTSLAADPETGQVYAHSTGGELICYSREGTLVWKHSLLESFGRASGYGGRLYTPVIDEDRVIIGYNGSSWGEHAKPAQRFAAFEKKSGQAIWISAPCDQPLDTTYATPAVATIGGRRLVICPSADGWVYGLLSQTGLKVWSYHFAARPLNTSPVVQGNRIYVSHSEENLDTTVMGRVACFDGSGAGDITGTAEIWRNDGIEAGYASPALANGRLYVADNSANLYCLNAEDGKEQWRHKYGRQCKGSPVVTADGIVYIGEVNGSFHILKDNGAACAELDVEEFKRSDDLIDEVQGSPAVVDGRVYLQTRYNTYCIGGKSDTRAPEYAAEKLYGLGPGMAEALLVVPCEVTLAPGESTTFQIREYSESGASSMQAIVAEDQEWSVKGVKGAFTHDGGLAFKAAPEPVFSAGTLTLKYHGKEAAVRVRVCPKPPFKVDFEPLAADSIPPAWLGVAGKTKVVERDGGKVLQKLAEKPSPPFMRIRTYMTPPIAGGYTIQADMLGMPKKPNWKPDMGLVNARYELFLMGTEPSLRLTTWPAIPRLQKDVPFDWKTDTWYTVKLQVQREGDKGIVRGKVWPRGESEPKEWTVELIDPFPIPEGSPALYGYSNGTTAKSKGTEIFYDNIEVRPNE